MKKIIPIKHDKIWGYEKWLYSPLVSSQSKTEDGTKIIDGPLIKILKVDQPLSVQVHPDDKLAKKLENEPNGKTECWYVLEKTKKTEFIVGLKSFDKNEIRDAFKNKTFRSNLKIIKPKVGEFIYVPAGMVHGVGAQSKVLEVQQPSDTTYRLYDYDRLQDGKPRELHIEKSLQSIKDVDWKKEPISISPLEYQVLNYKIEINTKNQILKEDCIVIDLKEEVAYVANSGEEVKFNHYAIVKY